MKVWQKMLIPTLITLVVAGIYMLSVWRHRQEPGVASHSEASQAENKDDLVVIRAFFPAHFEDTHRLVGKTVWMKNGYTMSYYPYVGGEVQFGKRLGVIPSAERLEIAKIIKVNVPVDTHDGVEPAGKQAMAVFTMGEGKQLYATAIGVTEPGQEAYYCDLLFFYDDPRIIYSHWTSDAWAAIEAHQVKPGMTEMQVRLAIGQNSHSDSANEGDRLVTYDQAGKHWAVTFVKNKATTIKSD